MHKQNICYKNPVLLMTISVHTSKEVNVFMVYFLTIKPAVVISYSKLLRSVYKFTEKEWKVYC